jgi:hypothetical protein
MRKAYRWSREDDLVVSNADRLLCWAIEHGGFRHAKTLLRLADASWVAMLDANAVEPYEHRRYKACEKLVRLYLKRLFDRDFAAHVEWVAHESGILPTHVVKYMANGAK